MRMHQSPALHCRVATAIGARGRTEILPSAVQHSAIAPHCALCGTYPRQSPIAVEWSERGLLWNASVWASRQRKSSKRLLQGRCEVRRFGRMPLGRASLIPSPQRTNTLFYCISPPWDSALGQPHAQHRTPDHCAHRDSNLRWDAVTSGLR